MEKQERYVAYFDMLGFKRATLRNSAGAWKALVTLYNCKEDIAKLTIEISTSGEIVRDRVKFFIFSDGILFFSLSDQDSDLVAILIMVSELFGRSLHNCVPPLRGGIAHGEFFYNFKLNLFCGVPFVNAYSIGETAQWSGIVVDERVAEHYKKVLLPTSHNGSIISQWDVPCKNGQTRKSYVINWPDIFRKNFTKNLPISVEDYYMAFENLFGPYKDLLEDDKLKYKNTVDFINSFK